MSTPRTPAGDTNLRDTDNLEATLHSAVRAYREQRGCYPTYLLLTTQQTLDLASELSYSNVPSYFEGVRIVVVPADYLAGERLVVGTPQAEVTR